jgi:hypothetical protein
MATSKHSPLLISAAVVLVLVVAGIVWSNRTKSRATIKQGPAPASAPAPENTPPPSAPSQPAKPSGSDFVG